MLGPIFFIEPSCKLNIDYISIKNVGVCAPLILIKKGRKLNFSLQYHHLCPNQKLSRSVASSSEKSSLIVFSYNRSGQHQ